MAAFGADFDLREFKAAYESVTDMDAYNRVQALERALGRVQNYVADLAIAGTRLAQLSPRPDAKGSTAHHSLPRAARRQGHRRRAVPPPTRAQDARTRIEHGYIETPAGRVHDAATLIHDAARDFIGTYRRWVEPRLTDG